MNVCSQTSLGLFITSDLHIFSAQKPSELKYTFAPECISFKSSPLALAEIERLYKNQVVFALLHPEDFEESEAFMGTM